MYDLIDIIDVKLSGMEKLINKWMINNQLIKSSLLEDIHSIKMNINKYHNKYIICKNWKKYGNCKYDAHCWYFHPTNRNDSQPFNNNNNNNSNNNNNNFPEKAQEFSEESENNHNETKENDKENSGKNNNFQEYSNNIYDYSESEYFDSDTDNESDESDDSDYDNNNYGNTENKKENSQEFQTVKKKRKRKKKKQYKKKQYKKKSQSNKNNTQAKKVQKNSKQNLDNLIKQTNNPHWQHLMQHYKCGICFKYMNGTCNDNQCKYKHPQRCINYTHSNGFQCDYKNKCNFAHIDNR